MADHKDLASNPFAALFPSLHVADQYRIEAGKQYEESKQSGIVLFSLSFSYY